MPTDARTEILDRIRAALTSTAEACESIPRDYRQNSSRSRHEVVQLFKERLQDYDAQVSDVLSPDLTASIARSLQARGTSRILIPRDFPQKLLPAGFTFVTDEGLSHSQMNDCDGVLTESTLGIAETGTIVLQHGSGQGRRAVTLVPDYHLCLVRADTLVLTVPEAIARLQATAHLPTTFISGPSATADVEMTRIKGVHGPRFLHVILLG